MTRYPAPDRRAQIDDQPRDAGISRRTFLGAVGAGSLLGTAGASSVRAAGDPTAFVEVEGTDFVVDGEPIYFHGANNFWIVDAYRGTEEYIDENLALFEEMGITFLRTFVTCEGGSAGCYIPEPYVHAEEGFRTLDYLVARAADHGIRLVLILADNWDHNGGIPQYIEWIDGADHHGDFYVDEDAKDLYRWHVEEVLTRENTVTGLEYREDPTIAMWELCNEPRLEGDGFGDEDPGYEERASILEDWIAEMSAFIKEIDPNHLVSTGMEGFYTREGSSHWFENEWTGQDFLRHHDIDTIDAASFHLYPYHWDFPHEYGTVWITEHIRDAHETLGMPGYCGEFNVNATSGLETRHEVLAEWYEALDASNANAAMIWQIVVDGTEDHDGFQVYQDESGDVLDVYREAARAKSEALGGAPLHPPSSVVVETGADAIAVEWSRVSEASEYVVSLDGDAVETTAETAATVGGLEGGLEYEVGVAAVGAGGEETDLTTTSATTVDETNVGYPEWVSGDVYEDGDRVVHDGIVWEAQWYTDDDEPRFESGYAWSFVEIVGTGVESDEGENGDGDENGSGGDPADLDVTGDGNPAQDLTGDGLYEDITGDGQLGFNDVVTFFEEHDGAVVQDNVASFDFSGNGQVGFTDVVALFERL